MARTFLITGGAGFIGSNLIRHVFAREPDATVINLDALTYAGVKATVSELDELGDHVFVHGDIRDAKLVDDLTQQADVILHLAAESHVDRSIDGPAVFLDTNVVGTGVLIDAACRHNVSTFVHVSTDEVYGSIDEGFPTEEAPLLPSSPYSASKAGSDLLVQSYGITYDYQAIITRCTNNYGAYQFPEKLIPLSIVNLLHERPIGLYGDGLHERDWLHVDDHVSAIYMLVDNGRPGETYNISAGAQTSNLELAERLVTIMGSPENAITFITDRPGHDRRYALDSTKLRALGWDPTSSLDERLAETVAFYTNRRDWWEPLMSGSR